MLLGVCYVITTVTKEATKPAIVCMLVWVWRIIQLQHILETVIHVTCTQVILCVQDFDEDFLMKADVEVAMRTTLLMCMFLFSNLCR